MVVQRLAQDGADRRPRVPGAAEPGENDLDLGDCAAAARACGAWLRSSPSSTMEPAFGCSRPVISGPIVVLPLPGLADQAKGLARADREADPGHGAGLADLARQHRARGDGEVLDQVIGLQQDLVRTGGGRAARGGPLADGEVGRLLIRLAHGEEAAVEVIPAVALELRLGYGAVLCTYRHRAANRQAVGGLVGSGGWPGMPELPSGAPATAWSGRAPSRAAV